MGLLTLTAILTGLLLTTLHRRDPHYNVVVIAFNGFQELSWAYTSCPSIKAPRTNYLLRCHLSKIYFTKWPKQTDQHSEGKALWTASRQQYMQGRTLLHWGVTLTKAPIVTSSFKTNQKWNPGRAERLRDSGAYSTYEFCTAMIHMKACFKKTAVAGFKVLAW